MLKNFLIGASLSTSNTSFLVFDSGIFPFSQRKSSVIAFGYLFRSAYISGFLQNSHFTQSVPCLNWLIFIRRIKRFLSFRLSIWNASNGGIRSYHGPCLLSTRELVYLTKQDVKICSKKSLCIQKFMSGIKLYMRSIHQKVS